jgi:lauroyl/myristoyl acyltransferase
MKVQERMLAPLLWLGYQGIIGSPYAARKKVASAFVSEIFYLRMSKIEKNIKLLNSDLSSNQIKWGIEKLKKVTAENYTFLLSSKSLNIKKEMERLEVTGEIEQVLDLYRSGKKMIVVSSHTGPHDIALLLFTYKLEQILAPRPLMVFILAENIPIFNIVTNDLRKVAGDNVHFGLVEKGKILVKASERINKGYIVVFGFDMVRDNGRGVLCPIGDNAQGFFPSGWAALALREDAIVVPVLPSSKEEGKIRVDVGMPFEPEKTFVESEKTADEKKAVEKKDIERNVLHLVGMYDSFFRDHFDDWMQLPSVDLEFRKRLES